MLRYFPKVIELVCGRAAVRTLACPNPMPVYFQSPSCTISSSLKAELGIWLRIQPWFHVMSLYFISSQVLQSAWTITRKEISNLVDMSVLFLYFYMFKKQISQGTRGPFQLFLAELCAGQDGADQGASMRCQLSPQAPFCLWPHQ